MNVFIQLPQSYAYLIGFSFCVENATYDSSSTQKMHSAGLPSPQPKHKPYIQTTGVHRSHLCTVVCSVASSVFSACILYTYTASR